MTQDSHDSPPSEPSPPLAKGLKKSLGGFSPVKESQKDKEKPPPPITVDITDEDEEEQQQQQDTQSSTGSPPALRQQQQPATGRQQQKKSETNDDWFHIGGSSSSNNQKSSAAAKDPPPAAAKQQQQQQQQQATNGARRVTRNNSNGNNNRAAKMDPPAAKKKSAQENRQDNETIFDEFLKQAEFEVNQDCYRGIVLERKKKTTTNGNSNSNHHEESPWKDCQFKKDGFRENREYNKELILNLDNAAKNDMDASNLSQAWIEEACNCRCPSLISWTRESIMKERQAAKKKKKRKQQPKAAADAEQQQEWNAPPPQIGQRPTEPDYRCPCDYNPYCTSSLGGICSSIWQETAQNVLDTKRKQHRDYQNMVRVQQRQDYRDRHGYSPMDGFSSSSDVEVEVIGSTKSNKTAKRKNEDNNNKNHNGVEVMDLCDEQDIDTTAYITTIFPEEMGAHNDMEYSARTITHLKNVRPCAMVQAQPIRDYLHTLLSKLPPEKANSVTVDELLDRYIKWQETLAFVNPLQDKLQATHSRLPIALPPGILNLGATCYLNTQLQCLAQNKDFLEGIVSWREAEVPAEQAAGGDSSHHTAVNSVLTELQSILAELVDGSARTISTMEFSTALGLQHDEQQDPNEFARLLFEMLHTSFQHQPGLEDLLPRLFEGETTYTTTCSSCKTKSCRKEKFMDLNLPIVQPPNEDKDKVKEIGRKIYHFFSKVSGGGNEVEETKLPNADADSDLQYCLDQYSTIEHLSGDNQYDCSVCGGKRNATRETNLGSLPPVLNVQLSRYVFDRATLMKKKSTDKVLLPRKLQVETKQSDPAGDTSRTKTYILCSVMKHLGTSAYSGHYIAESMDFLTGQWFEFNDEKVTILENGPSCSYIPSFGDDDVAMADANEYENETKQPKSKNKVPKLKGSADAYNMYYVEETFLSNSALRSFETIKKQLDGETNESEDAIRQGIIQKREGLFADIGEWCVKDRHSTERLRSRKKRLREEMFSLKANTKGAVDGAPVWVDAELLRRFVSCKDSLEDVFRRPLGEPLLRHKHLLCEHQSLHPRTARRGKLLPRTMYDSYIRLLRAEHRQFHSQESNSRFSEEAKADEEQNGSDLNDCMITPTNKLLCPECGSSYRKELQEKLKNARLLKDIYKKLDPKCSDWEHEIGIWKDDSDSDSENDEEEDPHAFIVSKKSVTAFRNEIQDFLNKIIGKVSGSIVNNDDSKKGTKRTSKEDLAYSLAEGLDAIDLSRFKYSEAADKSDIGKDIDVKLNSQIVCPHGSCTEACNKQRVRWLKHSGWIALKTFFPDAIELKLRRIGDKNQKDAGSPCEQCERESTLEKKLTNVLESWHETTFSRGDCTLRWLTKDKQVNQDFVDEIELTTQSQSPLECVFVHRSDIVTWQRIVDSVKSLKRNGKQKNTVDVKAQIEDHLRLQTLDWSKYAKNQLEDGFLKPLKCANHDKLSNILCKKAEDSVIYELASGIRMLTKLQYACFAESITDIIKIMDKSDGVIDLSEETSPPNPVLSSRLKSPVALATKADGDADDTREDESILLRHPYEAKSKIRLILCPQMCTNEDCIRDFDSQTAEALPMGTPKAGTAADDPIVVGSDTEEDKDMFNLKVYEMETGANVDEALSTLMELKILNVLGTGVDSYDLSGASRRSRRKRKPLFPTGKLLSEDTVKVAMRHNGAALRLFLYQQGLPINQRLLLVYKAPASPEALTSGSPQGEWGDFVENHQCVEPRTHELGIDNSDKTLEDAYATITQGDDPEFERLGDPETSLILLRQPFSEPIGFREEELMDIFLDASNAAAANKDSKATGNKKQRAAERGFAGSLLSRRAPTETSSDDGTKRSQETTNDANGATVSEDDGGSRPQKKLKVTASPSNDMTPGSHKTSPKEEDAACTPASNSSEPSNGSEPSALMVLENVKSTGIIVIARDNEAVCYEAAEWAIKQAPSESLVKLTESCIQKIFDSLPLT